MFHIVRYHELKRITIEIERRVGIGRHFRRHMHHRMQDFGVETVCLAQHLENIPHQLCCQLHLVLWIVIDPNFF